MSRAVRNYRHVLCFLLGAAALAGGCGSEPDHEHEAKEVHTQRAGLYTLSLTTEAGHIGLGSESMRLEIRDAEGGRPVSVGPVTISWARVDSSEPARRLELQPKSDGRYEFVWDLWSGRWNVSAEWTGARADFVLTVL